MTSIHRIESKRAGKSYPTEEPSPMTIRFGFSFLTNLVNDSTIGQDGFSFILASDGVFIAHPDPDVTMQLNINELEGLSEDKLNRINNLLDL